MRGPQDGGRSMIYRAMSRLMLRRLARGAASVNIPRAVEAGALPLALNDGERR